MGMIKTFADVYSGLNPRKKISHHEDGDTYFIQPGNLKTGGFEYSQKIFKTDYPIKEHHYLSGGDVLFVAKGSRPTAWVFTDSPLPVVPNSSFFILRVKTHEIDPGFLAWWLSRPATMVQLTGSSASKKIVPFVSKSSLQSLRITPPPLEKQSVLGEMFQLRGQELQHMQILQSKYEQFYTQQIEQFYQT